MIHDNEEKYYKNFEIHSNLLGVKKFTFFLHLNFKVYMAKFILTPYDLLLAPQIQIQSELNLNDDSVFISYKITGDLSTLDLGAGRALHRRVIKLWEKSCFELFIKNHKDSYIEFNFSPEFEWNSFYFEKKG